MRNSRDKIFGHTASAPPRLFLSAINLLLSSIPANWNNFFPPQSEQQADPTAESSGFVLGLMEVYRDSPKTHSICIRTNYVNFSCFFSGQNLRQEATCKHRFNGEFVIGGLLHRRMKKLPYLTKTGLRVLQKTDGEFTQKNEKEETILRNGVSILIKQGN